MLKMDRNATFKFCLRSQRHQCPLNISENVESGWYFMTFPKGLTINKIWKHASSYDISKIIFGVSETPDIKHGKQMVKAA